MQIEAGPCPGLPGCHAAIAVALGTGLCAFLWLFKGKSAGPEQEAEAEPEPEDQDPNPNRITQRAVIKWRPKRAEHNFLCLAEKRATEIIK